MHNKKNNWKSRCCINNKNLAYIELLLVYFKIQKYKEQINKYGELDLIIDYNRKTYKVVVDGDLMGLRLLLRNQALNHKNKEFYRLVDCFYGDDCWYEVCEFIVSGGNNDDNRKVNFNLDI